ADMGTDSVTSDAIADGTIIGDDLAADISISTTGIVTAAEFFGDGANLSNVPATVADGSITAAKMTTDSVTTSAILNANVTAAKLASNAAVLSIASQEAARLTGVVDVKAGNNVTITQTGQTIEVAASVTGGSGTVTSVGTGTGLTGGPISTTGTISVAAGGITAGLIATNAVTSGAIANGTITAADMGTGSVTSDAIFNGTIVAADLATGSVTSGAILNNTIVGADIATTSTITAAAFFGTFEGTYTGVYEKGVAFLYPYTTSQSFIRLPYNAQITSVEVYCNGGTNVTGRVYNAGAAAYITAAGVSATAGNWAVAPSISTPNYTANQTLRFETSVVTGTVSGATVLVRYKRRP
ncbi:hypothetical protein ACFL4F_01970, partial [Candidatus Margulisiibacteriota bacterium]